MNSLFRTFQLKLTIATLFMLIFLSLTYYEITKATLFDNAKSELMSNAKIVKEQLSSKKLDFDTALSILGNMNITIDMVSENEDKSVLFSEYSFEKKQYLSFLFSIQN